MRDRYAASVIGPSALFPQGFAWLAVGWAAAAAAALTLAHWPPYWFRVPAGTGLAIALITFLGVLGTLRSNAFLAGSDGIWLGTRSGARRRWRRGRLRHLPWSEVSELRLRKAPFGAVLEVLPGQRAAASARPCARRTAGRAARWLFLLVLPLACVCCRPALTAPARDPARYRIPLRAITVEELRAALRAVAPSHVAIAVQGRRGAARAAPALPDLGVPGITVPRPGTPGLGAPELAMARLPAPELGVPQTTEPRPAYPGLGIPDLASQAPDVPPRRRAAS